MRTQRAIAIFDIGKTNKKLFVFDTRYQIIFEKSLQLEETCDDDGDACENLDALRNWVNSSIAELFKNRELAPAAINVCTYGASFVHVDKEGIPTAPLYNYLKSFPPSLQQKFYAQYGGEAQFSLDTASPSLGNLNSGLQLYFLKHKKPALFAKTHYSLHLPQYISWLVSGRFYSDITSIGCHTGLWNFAENRYHEWLYKEGIAPKLAPIFPSDQLMNTNWQGQPLLCGSGLHDTSAALIPYLSGFNEPFVLISTGTWCITLNPFNHERLTLDELKQDCLCYMEYRGRPIKASRVFAGYEHEWQVKKLAAHFNVAVSHYRDIQFDAGIAQRIHAVDRKAGTVNTDTGLLESAFASRDMNSFETYSEAYHQLLVDLVTLQVASTNLVIKNCAVSKIFVDGGFGKNQVYMHLLAVAFPEMSVYAASVSQATALGAAMAVHPYWNESDRPANLIELKHYAGSPVIQI